MRTVDAGLGRRPAAPQQLDGGHRRRGAQPEEGQPDPLATPFGYATRHQQADTERQRRTRPDQESELPRLQVETLHVSTPSLVPHANCAPGGAPAPSVVSFPHHAQGWYDIAAVTRNCGN